MHIITLILLYGIPAASLIFFVCSLISFCRAKMKSKRSCEPYNKEELFIKRILLIVSSVIFGVLTSFLIAVILLLYTAVSFM